ncbi:MAG: Rrf2 family transcriptional regulator [Proteobacteria bacterium]|nr:Rrf2 family transcriptional regulator [Pseudomonadota bacterium]
MFYISQKNKYALKALYELAKHKGEGPLKTAEISKRQRIPLKFLEVILAELKRSKIIAAKRGYQGGYTFVGSPEKISVGDVIRFIAKQPDKDDCIACGKEIKHCPYIPSCAFFPLWQKAHDAIFRIYDETTLQDLLENKHADGIFSLK